MFAKHRILLLNTEDI